MKRNRLVVFHHHVLEFARKRGIPEAEALAETRAMGFEGLAADHAVLSGRDGDRALFDECGLPIRTIFSHIDLFHEEANDCSRMTEDLLKTAAAFGTDNVMILPGVFHDDDNREAALNRLCEALDDVCQRAMQLGIAVTIEDYDAATSPSNDAAGCLRILTRVPRLGLTFDTGNLPLPGEDPLAAYELLRGRIVLVHLKDRPAGPDGRASRGAAAVGDGVLGLERLVSRMLRDGYAGDFVAEHFGVDDYETAMRRSAAFCKRLLAPVP